MMTELQQKRAHALSHCNLPFHGSCRDFIRDMLNASKNPEVAIISPNQAKALEGYCWKFRKQLATRGHADLVPETDPYKVEVPKVATPEPQTELKL